MGLTIRMYGSVGAITWAIFNASDVERSRWRDDEYIPLGAEFRPISSGMTKVEAVNRLIAMEKCRECV